MVASIGFRLCSEACSTRLRIRAAAGHQEHSRTLLTGRKQSDSEMRSEGKTILVWSRGKGKPCPCVRSPSGRIMLMPISELTCGPRPSHTHISQPMETGPRPTQSSISHGNDSVWMTQSSASRVDRQQHLCIEVSSASVRLSLFFFILAFKASRPNRLPNSTQTRLPPHAPNSPAQRRTPLEPRPPLLRNPR
jgi:hypothetical protein